jgi:hypothetical protein
MRLPATTYRHGCNQDHCFAAHPVMGGETCHCARLVVHCTSPVTLEGGYNKSRIPQSLGFGLIHPASTWPRPSLDTKHDTTGKEGRHGTTPTSTVLSRIPPKVTMLHGGQWRKFFRQILPWRVSIKKCLWSNCSPMLKLLAECYSRYWELDSVSLLKDLPFRISGRDSFKGGGL